MSKTICLIDGDGKALKRNREILEMFGYRVIASERADTAFFEIMSGAVNLVISDVYLPGLSGIDLLEKMRGNKAKVPVLLLGGSLTDEMAERAAATGAVGFLEKPVSTVQMVAFIQKMFGSSNGNGNGKVHGNGGALKTTGIVIANGGNGNNQTEKKQVDATPDTSSKPKKKRFLGMF